MIKKKVTVNNPAGIHARPASIIVQEITQFESEFHVHMYGYRINGKSILGLLTLAAEQGAELELELDGPDEEAAMECMVKLFENGFKAEGEN
ncbi:HPr family phosphocarrier protein, partial [Balneolaceae bacterium ANBcel3]|nr:HPr family phosphocarrier protein [Balneolaceae bacterium ANBcel3]